MTKQSTMKSCNYLHAMPFSHSLASAGYQTRDSKASEYLVMRVLEAIESDKLFVSSTASAMYRRAVRTFCQRPRSQMMSYDP